MRQFSATSIDWQNHAEADSDERCDLTVLLNDEWRHRIVVRDDIRVADSFRSQFLAIEEESYSPIQTFLLEYPLVSIDSLALAVVHRMLWIYGGGSKTVVAFSKQLSSVRPWTTAILPTVINHVAQSEKTCMCAVEELNRELRREDAYLDGDDLIGRALFDAVIVRNDSGNTVNNLPFPLSIVICHEEANARLCWTLRYSADLFDDKVIAGVLEVVRELLLQIVCTPCRLVRDLDQVPEEQKCTLEKWNSTDGEFQAETRLEELFEESVRRTPGLIAIISGSSRLTYQELDDLCNASALGLLNIGLRPQETVALFMDKSELVVVAIFSIWKAGAAFVSIDPSYPDERVLCVIRDTGARRIVANRCYCEQLRKRFETQFDPIEIIEVESLVDSLSTKSQIDQKCRSSFSSDQTAYITFTSGTTGTPKGVAKYHRNVVNSITDLSERYEMLQAGEERVALFSAPVFEPFIRQMLIALINSQTLVVVPDNVRLDPIRFPDFVKEHGITYLNGTRSVLQHFDLHRAVTLKKILLVGEELSAQGLKQMRKIFHGTIVNEYSFTETAFVTAVNVFDADVVERPDRSIGRPLRNVKCYVLTHNLKQVPIGAIGELYIGGCGIAKGYLNRPSLTLERFVPNPFQSEQERRSGNNEVIYKTGDLARMLPSGEIEFKGRSDFQIKFQGIRVEPGEIEARVVEYPGVRQCVVVSFPGPGGEGDWRLVGYFVADAECVVTEAELLTFLETRLMRVLIPARLVRLENFAINVNGKVDRRALPLVELIGSSAICSLLESEKVSRPHEDLRDALRAIWGEVLGIRSESIDERDDFFRLGGQSIACIQLMLRVWQQLRLVLSVEDVFRLKTLDNFASHLANQKPQWHVSSEEVLSGQSITIAASGLQQGLLYHASKRGLADDAYVMQSVYRYGVAIRCDLMEQAWLLAQRKYPSLRVRFEWRDEAVQIIASTGDARFWRFVDLSSVPDLIAQDASISELRKQDRLEPYYPAIGPLFRVYLIKRRENQFVLLFSCHHLILDGWSLQTLQDDVHHMYLQLLENREIDESQDHAYIATHRYWEKHRHDHVVYWQQQANRITEYGDFGGLLNERTRYKVRLNQYDKVIEHKTKKLHLGVPRTAALKATCAANRVTLHSALQFVWHRVLHVFGGCRITAVGTIVSGRNLPIDGIENSVGLFINTLPLVVDHQEQANKTVARAIAEIQDGVNLMSSRFTIDLGQLPSGELKRSLFDTLLVLENYPRVLNADESQRQDQLLQVEREYDADYVDYPIAVVAREESDELTVSLSYAGELFEDDTIETILDTVVALFGQVAANMSLPVRELEYLSPNASKRFEKWNTTNASFPEDKTLHSLFEDAAAQWPDNLAIVYKRTQLSYSELNSLANRLARHFCTAIDLKPGDLVALVMDKSEKMIGAILGVWKAGAAYVPIDPAYPDDRIAFMLEDTEARLLVTEEAHIDRMRSLSGGLERSVVVADISIDGPTVGNPASAAQPRDLAYAIYTSGTTGRPKAVLVEHQGVVNLYCSLARTFSLARGNADEAIFSFSNYVFDHFVEQMTDALLSGQTLVLLDEELRTDNERLYRYLNDNRVTYLSGTPSVLSLYDFSSVQTLTRIDAIGEDLSFSVFNRIRASFRGQIINGYGPTEISITSHKRLYGPGEYRLDKSIGFPIANTTCYVLDRALKRVPVGAIGELYIGGVGVARGYLNRDELTAQRFLDNPFRSDLERHLGSNSRIYRTGDLVRWLPNGELEFLGREDTQVKIHGQRVELGEIEGVLSSYPGVRRAVVVAREYCNSDVSAPQKYLVAFYLSEHQLPERAIKNWLRTKLPLSVVPAFIIQLEELPVTSSGKLDLSRLPPTGTISIDDFEFVPPSGVIENRLFTIWSKLLPTVTRIGAQNDFFALGGDSLRAIQLAQAIAEVFDRPFRLADVFEYRTIEAQGQQIEQGQKRADEHEESARGLAASFAGSPPVSLAQERLLFIDEFVGGTAAYNIQFALELRINTRVTANTIIAALNAIVMRHAALRTLLTGERNGIRRQSILTPVDAHDRLYVEELVAKDRDELDSMLDEECGHIFRLSEELPIQAKLFSLAEKSDLVYLSLVFHHTCIDGLSWGIFQREFAALVMGVSDADLSLPVVTYADFAVWQRSHLTDEQLLPEIKFWNKTLADFVPLNLALDRPRPPQFDYQGKEVQFSLDAQTCIELQSIALEAKVPFFSVLLGAYFLLLEDFAGQSDLVVGIPSENRQRPEFEGVIGFFANLLAIRVKVDRRLTLLEYVRAVGTAVADAQIHQKLPFEQLVKGLRIERDASRHPICQTVFSMLAPPLDTSPWGVPLRAYYPDSCEKVAAKFDLSATVRYDSTGLIICFTYATSLFEPTTARRFTTSFETILRNFARLASEAATSQISTIGSLDEDGRAELLSSVQHVTQALPHEHGLTLHGLFEAVVAQCPDAVALTCMVTDLQLTYREVDERANALAHYLRNAQVTPNQLVALVMDKSERMIIAILAVWKSGGAYVPIDSGYPDDRLAFVLDDSKASLVLVDGEHENRVRAILDRASLVVNLDSLDMSSLPTNKPVDGVVPGNLAYAIYTSGTSGNPNAVLVRHCNAVGFRNDIVDRYFGECMAPQQAILFTSNYAFDFSIEQLAVSILCGNKLVLPPPQLNADDLFYEDANRHELSYLSGTPTQVTQLDLSRLEYLKIVIVAGEPFLQHHFEKIRREFAGPIINAYGTTETTVYNTIKRFNFGEPYQHSIGKPISNTTVYVLDRDNRLLPVGAIGELFITGGCVSAGYLNRPELTRSRFVLNILQSENEQRDTSTSVLYRTGDLVRWRPDGDLEFFGRNDQQVKINGLRIEPGEVAAVLAKVPGVRQCAVISQADNRLPRSSHLVGYYVREKGEPVTEDAALAFLRTKLPSSMIPIRLVELDAALPFTSNGKLKTTALPTVNFDRDRVAHAVPRSRLEGSLCKLFGEILPIGNVGIDDDFFRCGGDSITALQLASRVKRDLGLQVNLKRFFDFPTVRDFVDKVLCFASPNEDVTVLDPLIGNCALLPIQEWFFAKSLNHPERWNQYFTIRTPRLDIETLKSALDRLVAHHDAFRLRFRGTRDKVTQFYTDDVPSTVLYTLDVSGLTVEDIHNKLNEMQVGFDLESGPLHCAAYLHGWSDGSTRIFLSLHHLIVDVVSWRILAHDLEILYHGGDLGPRGISYRQWSQALSGYQGSLHESLHWSETIQRVTLELDTLSSRVIETWSRARCELNERQTRSLLIEGPRALDTSTHDLLLTALSGALRTITGQSTNSVTIESHGREPFDNAPDVRNTVGWFTTLYPLTLESSDDLEHCISLTKASRRKVPFNGLGYAILHGKLGSIEAPLPPISFNYLGQFTTMDASRAWQIDTSFSGVNQAIDDEGGKEGFLDVTVSCIDGRIVADISSRLGQAISQCFAERFRERLGSITSHVECVVGTESNKRTEGCYDFDPYLVANEGISSPTLFLLPPGEGGGESYLNNLARHLPGVRLVLFNNLHLRCPKDCFEDLAQYYVKHVRQLQPSGPYNFLGWSFGGVLSFEMAIQLGRAGESIRNVFLIDSFFNIRKAAADIGMLHVEGVLDPINYRYMPAKPDLEIFGRFVDRVTLFKASQMSYEIDGELQRQLFEYYVRSEYNNLETFLQPHLIRIEPMANVSHFSWVRDEESVASVGAKVLNMVELTR